MHVITRLPRCAYAIGSTPKSVSHWLARFPGLAGAVHTASAWHGFRPAAVVKLACLTRLIKYGFWVEEAVDLLATLDPILAPHLTNGPHGSWASVRATLADERLTVSRDKRGLYASLSPLDGDDRGDALHGADRLVLDLAAIAAACNDRLSEVVIPDTGVPEPAKPANDPQPNTKGFAPWLT